MRPGKYNFICPQGTTFSKQLSYLINSQPVDLTGYIARMQVREKHSSPNTILNLTVDNGGISVGECQGSITIYVSAEQTESLVPKKYVYDLEIASSENMVYRIIEGDFIVTPEVTR
jgi:hypothetical protein